MDLDEPAFSAALSKVTDVIRQRYTDLSTLPTTPTPAAVSSTVSGLPAHLPESGQGVSATTDYLLETLLPGILQAQAGPRYFGFVTGGVTPAAQIADIVSSSYDENVQVTLPGVTAATAIESRTLEMVSDLLDVPRDRYEGRTITTGATSSNVLGLACARDYLYSISPHLPAGYSYAQDGPPSSPTLPSPPIIILSLHPHFSILKAASLVGIGAGPKVVQTLPRSDEDELAFDITALRARLKEEKEVGRGVVVLYGLGEVNTGGLGGDLEEVAKACEEFGAWLHVDAAFGGFAGLMPGMEFLTKGIGSANSLTLDGHKWLNVPYDCGLFYTRKLSHLSGIFSPPSASAPAYLSSSSNTTTLDGPHQSHTNGEVQHELVPSPLYVNIENSRRFRALPLFASLLSLGKEGYRDIVRRNIEFAREIARYIATSVHYDLLNPSPLGVLSRDSDAIVPMNIVLFRGSSESPFSPTDPDCGAKLTAAINGTRKMYVTATKWRGDGAVRLAVSNWRSGGPGELDMIKSVLEGVALGISTPERGG